MKPEQALKLLDSLVSTIKLGREDHARVQQAVVILQKAIDTKKK